MMVLDEVSASNPLSEAFGNVNTTNLQDVKDYCEIQLLFEDLNKLEDLLDRASKKLPCNQDEDTKIRMALIIFNRSISVGNIRAIKDSILEQISSPVYKAALNPFLKRLDRSAFAV